MLYGLSSILYYSIEKMLALDIELKYNPIHRLFNKQVVPGVGELNKYEERQELRSGRLSRCFCWLHVHEFNYIPQNSLSLSDWYKNNGHFYVKKYIILNIKKNTRTESIISLRKIFIM